MINFSFSWVCERTNKTGIVNVSMPDTDQDWVDIFDDAELEAWRIVESELGHEDFELWWE